MPNLSVDTVQIVQVDERDSNWEGDYPRFRVYFQRTLDSYIGGCTDTYDITGEHAHACS